MDQVYIKMASFEVKFALSLKTLSSDQIAGRMMERARDLTYELQSKAKWSNQKAHTEAHAYYRAAIHTLSVLTPATTLINAQDPNGIGFRIEAFRPERSFF